VIEAQLGAFPERDVAALEAAAVAGQSFAAQSVGAALGVDPDVAEAACDLFAGTSGFLDRTDVASWPDGSVGQRYTFRHDAFRTALYKRSVGEALHFIEESGERLFEAEVLRVHGRLLEARGPISPSSAARPAGSSSIP
jgi:hypothetical protein